MGEIINSLFSEMMPKVKPQGDTIGVLPQRMPVSNPVVPPPAPKIGITKQAPSMVAARSLPTTRPEPRVAPVSPKKTPPTKTTEPVITKTTTAPVVPTTTTAPVVPTTTLAPQTQTADQETEVANTFDPTKINLEALQNLDLSNLNLEGLDTLTQQPADWASVYSDYSSFLSDVSSGNTAKKVNRRDDIYNNYFEQQGAGQFQGNTADLRASVGLSDAFAVYDNPEAEITSESVQGAYQALTGAASPIEALSDYYGFDFQPAVNEGANYTNASKYGVSAETMSEFHSLVEPVLQKSLPYIQATQGLNYTDALEYAYTHDPMVAALYSKYGVDLYRQTKDGSTYIFDPIAGQEIRTLEVKDPKFKDFVPAIAIAALTAGAGSALGGAIANSSLGASLGAAGSNALGGAVASLGAAAAQGKTGSDLLTAGVMGGIGGYAKGLANAADEAFSAIDAATSTEAWDAAAAAYDTAQAAADTAQTILNTARAVDAVANKNIAGAIDIGLQLSGVGGLENVVEKNLSKLAGGQDTLVGLNVESLTPAVTDVATNLISGKDFDEALVAGVSTYIRNEGSEILKSLGDQFKGLGDFEFNTPEGIKGIEDWLKTNWDDIKNSDFVEGIREAGRNIDDSFIQPVKTGLEGVVDTVDQLVDTPDVVKSIEDTLKDLPQTVDNLVDTPDAIKSIEDTLKDLPQTVDDLVDTPDWVKSIEDTLKNIKFPSLSLNLGGLSLPTIQSYSSMVQTPQLESTFDSNVNMVTPSELFAQKDYLAGLLD